MKKIVFFLLSPFLTFGQLSPKVDNLYKELLKNDRYEDTYIGFSAEESKIYNVSKQIDKLASDNEVEYIALNGNTVAKAYAAKILFKRKSKQFLTLFKNFLKDNELLQVMSGCTGYDSFLPDELYRTVFEEKDVVNQAKNFKKYKDSIANSKSLPHSFDKDILDDFKVVTKWTNPEIDSLLLKIEDNILSNKNSSQNLVDLVCEYNFYTDQKKKYFQYLLYFDNKYNSEMIKQYLNYLNEN
jgi:hypothetical protein